MQHYDPLNRIVARENNGVITTYVWDNWNLLEERSATGAVLRCYLYGAGQNEVVEAFGGTGNVNTWFWQDGRGNTAAISGDVGHLLERYRYGWQGNVLFYDENNAALPDTAFGTRFLFAGSLYQPDTGLYDMRNRFYQVALSRFLQSDPIGFKGDALNLYRYCGNDFVDRSDPEGLQGAGTGTLASQPPRPIQPDGMWEMARGNFGSVTAQAVAAAAIRGPTVKWSDEGNLNLHEPRAHGIKNPRIAVNAVTDPKMAVTIDGQALTAHYIMDVHYSDNVGPHNVVVE